MTYNFHALENKEEMEQFINAWEKSFLRQLPSTFYSWIFNNHNLIYGVSEGNEIVGGYCLLKQRAYLHNDFVNIGLCNNVFVHPQHQGKNLFVRLGRYALTDAENKGIKLAIGIPNKNALPGHKRVGWTIFNDINFLEKEPNLFQNVEPTNWIVEINSDNFMSYAKQIEDLSIKLSQSRSFSIIKDKQYFQWRYIERPFSNYRIFGWVKEEKVYGYIVLKYYEPLKRIHIIDIEALNQDVFKDLLSMIHAFKSPYLLVNVWGTTYYRELFLDLGFRLSEEKSHLIAIYPYKKETVFLKNRLNIVLGDNDVF